MDQLPPLPKFQEPMMEVEKVVEFEVQSGGKTHIFVFILSVEALYDEEKDEVVIECSRERIDL